MHEGCGRTTRAWGRRLLLNSRLLTIGLLAAGILAPAGTAGAAVSGTAGAGKPWSQPHAQPAQLEGADPFIQQGPFLHDSERSTTFGSSVAISADGSTAVVGAAGADGGAGAVWVYARAGDGWVEQARLVGAGEAGLVQFGAAVAISADGSTVLVGAPYDGARVGAAWVFTRSGGVWSEQGQRLTGAGEVGAGQFGSSVALSADGSTALVGALMDDGEVGAAWVFVRSGGAWSQQGSKLVGSGGCGLPTMGNAVALSGDGNTAIVAGSYDCDRGAVWTFSRSGSSWSQQGSKLTASGEVGKGFFASSVALTPDSQTLLVGAAEDERGKGAAWTYTRAGAGWQQQGGKLTGSEEKGNGHFGTSVALAADGDTALVGGIYENTGMDGSAWVFKRSGATWSQPGQRLTGAGLGTEPLQHFGGGFGRDVALSAEGQLGLIAGGHGGGLVGGVWTFASQTGSAQPAAEFGRCVQVASAPGGAYTGRYASAACTKLKGGELYEWFPGPLATGFTIATLPGAALTLETVGRTALTCGTAAGTGEYLGDGLSDVGSVVLTLSGCAMQGAKCSSAGALPGQILTSALRGELGITKLARVSAKNKIGLAMTPEAEGGSIAQFTCGPTTVSLRGSLIAAVPTGAMLNAIGLTFSASKGRQKPEGIIEGSAPPLQLSLDAGAYEPAGLTWKATQANGEPLEVNAALSESCLRPANSKARSHGRKHPALRRVRGRACAPSVAVSPRAAGKHKKAARHPRTGKLAGSARCAAAPEPSQATAAALCG